MPLPDGLRRDDVQIAYPTTVAEVICGDKTGRSSQKKWKASTRVRRGSAEVPLGDWIIDECNLRKADLPAVGQTLQVYWPLDRAWYSGRVLSYTEAQGSTQVVYDDGEVEMLHMAMERYKVSPETSRALQIMPSPDDVIDLSSLPDDVIDLSFSGDLDAICPHPMPQLTAAAAKFSDLVVASHLVVKKEPDQPTTAAKPAVQTQTPAGVQMHADNQSSGLPSKTPVQNPGSVSKARAKQLTKDAANTKPATRTSARQPDYAEPSATAPAAVRFNTLKTTVAKHIQQGVIQDPPRTTQASPAQTAAKSPQAQHDSSQTSRPKPALAEGLDSRSHQDLHGTTSGKSLQSVLKPTKRVSLHQLKPNGLRPLPDRPARATQCAQHTKQAQHAHHAKQAQHAQHAKQVQAQQLKGAHSDHALPQTLQCAGLGQVAQSQGQQPQEAALGQRSQAMLQAGFLPAKSAAQPGTPSVDRGACRDEQHKAKRIKLEPDTNQQQEVVQHETSPSEASTHAMHIPEPDAAAQTAMVVADKLPSQLLQQFGLGAKLDAAQKQSALEELVLAVADAGVTARFFANLDKHDAAEAEQNLSRYYRSISVLVQSTHGQVQVADVIRTYIDSLCQA